MKQYLLFTLGERRLALPLEALRRVVLMVEITPLPDPPDLIRGVVNVQGEAVPVFDLRRLVGLAPRPPSPSDHLILARAGERTIALHVDAAQDIIPLPSEKTMPLEGLNAGPNPAEGIASVEDDLVLLVDPQRLVVDTLKITETCRDPDSR